MTKRDDRRLLPIAGGATALSRRRGYSPLAIRRALYGYACLLPWIIGFVVFTAGPIIASFGISLTFWPILREAKWAGLDNYHEMLFIDPLFWQSLKVTSIYCLFAVPAGVIVGYLIASIPQPEGLGIVGLADDVFHAVDRAGHSIGISLDLDFQS